MTRVISQALPARDGQSISSSPVLAAEWWARAGVGLCVLLLAFASTRAVMERPGAAAASNPPPASWLTHETLLTVYGRAFGIAPGLGRLGMDHSFADVERQVRPFQTGIAANDGRSGVRVAIHLIYALATPCTASPKCLLYLDDLGNNLVKQYIEPAARRGWLVVLDDQLGRSTPAREMQRMLRKGYLAYDNVEVAFDPEFRTAPGQEQPGSPTGHVTAAELNAAQAVMQQASDMYQLDHRKLMLVHEWVASMIRHPRKLRNDLPYVQPVVVMDGQGTPADKTRVYGSLLAGKNRVVPGIKLFDWSPYEEPGQYDAPAMTWQQVFGREPTLDASGNRYFMRPVPKVIVLT